MKVFMESKQVAGIRRAVRLGKTLQSDLGEKLRDFYKGGGTIYQAIDEFDVREIYAVTYSVARVGIRLALAGSNWDNRSFEPYDGLIEDEMERDKIRREHLAESGKSIGNKMYLEGKGIHTQTPEERRKLAFRGGKTMGNKAYKEKLGVHARSQSQMRKDSLKALVARGGTLWSEEEIKLVHGLKRDGYKTLEIAQSLNGSFHNGEEIRTIHAVGYILYQYKKAQSN